MGSRIIHDLGEAFYSSRETRVNQGDIRTTFEATLRPMMFAAFNGYGISLGPPENRSDECAICHDTIKHDEISAIHTEGCGWAYHPDCLSEWVLTSLAANGSFSCPSCRADITFGPPWVANEVRRLFSSYILSIDRLRAYMVSRVQEAYARPFSANLDLKLNPSMEHFEDLREIRVHLNALRHLVIQTFKTHQKAYWTAAENFAHTILLQALSTRPEHMTYREVRRRLREQMRTMRIIVAATFEVDNEVSGLMNGVVDAINDYNQSGDEEKFHTTLHAAHHSIIRIMGDTLNIKVENTIDCMEMFVMHYDDDNTSDGSTSSTESDSDVEIQV